MVVRAPPFEEDFQMNVGRMLEADAAVDQGVAFLRRHLENLAH
ncbi:Hypothetical protein CAP_6670 [Chondromyces apiculatus DSM 436]|uniref:Uncharacterized protein n=1 Tax=Chondromyces apiculatus DSM 436 TaxID=1192034 RepID=A0A017T1C5_9BACT|nr:Hypothetical protein CAP_6670 [Chondromyces apiculatus DSM 436]